MAVAYMDRQVVSRGAGQSVLAKAAYNSCSSLSTSEGQKDYTHKQGLAYEAILTHDGTAAPARGVFWRGVESRETRKNAQIAYSYVAALPVEVDRERQIAIAQDYARWIMDRYGCSAADVCIHHPVKRRRGANLKKENPHVHILTPTRDKDGNKIRLFNDRNDLKAARKAWEQIVNRHLQDARVDARISMDNAATQLHQIDDDIRALKAREEALQNELTAIRGAIEDGRKIEEDRTRYRDAEKSASSKSRQNPHGTDQQRNIGSKNIRRVEETNRRFADRDGAGAEEHRASPGAHRRTAEPGRSPDNPSNTGILSGHRGQAGNIGDRLSQPVGEIAAIADRIAGRIDGLRYERQAQRHASQITAMSEHIASMIDGVRYGRQAEWQQQQHEETDALRL